MENPPNYSSIEDVERGIESKDKNRDSISLNEASCRICFGGEEDGHLFCPCKCSGSIKYVHVTCLQKWRSESINSKAYFRCEQCLYNYNLKRITANNLITHRIVIPLLTSIIMLLSWAFFSVLCYYFLGPETLTQIFSLPPIYSSAFAGFCAIGLAGFMLMAFIEGGPDLNDPCGCENGENEHCCCMCCQNCNLFAWDFPAGAEGCLALAAALLVVVVVGYGIIGSFIFVYSKVKLLAIGTRNKLSTVVLEVGSDLTPPSSPRLNEKAAKAANVSIIQV